MTFHDWSLSICTECLSNLTSSMKKFIAVESSEAKVRNLQYQLLQEMEKDLKNFHEEFSKMGRVIQSSDGKCLEHQMRLNGKAESINHVFQLRNRVLEVLNDLSEFNDILDRKLFSSEQATTVLPPELPTDTIIKTEQDDYDHDEYLSDPLYHPDKYDNFNDTHSDEDLAADEEVECDLSNLDTVSPPLKKRGRPKNQHPTYQCPFVGCGRILDSRSRFEKHKESCKVSKKKLLYFLCDVCGMSGFNREAKEDYYQHKLTHASVSEREETISNGIEQSSWITRIRCSTCEKIVSHIQNLWPHMRVHLKQDKKQTFECLDECGRSFKTIEEARQHSLRCDGVPQLPPSLVNFKCEICEMDGFNCDNKEDYYKHKLSHASASEREETMSKKQYKWRTWVGRVKCSMCDKSIRMKMLQTHMKTHLEDKEKTKVQCDQCPFISVNRPSLIRHIKIVHPSQEVIRRFSCTICDKKFKENGTLKRHLFYHKDVRPFLCERKCGLALKSKASLKRHQMICDGTPSPYRRPKKSKLIASSFTSTK